MENPNGWFISESEHKMDDFEMGTSIKIEMPICKMMYV
jgi:hypothetical protein